MSPHHKETLASGKYLSLIKLDGYEMVERINCTDIVSIVPVTPANEAVLIEQYRKPLDRRVIEWPAGLVNDIKGAPEESREQAAHRELLEETGYKANHLEHAAFWPTSCGMTSETVHVYLARDVEKAGDGGGDGTEDIKVHLVPLAKVQEFLKAMEQKGCLIDSKILGGLYLLQQSH